ncbi:MAG: ParA family protein [Chloroflexi bacterium]|uniref:AAA family ATPase n=1 Tax=Candidatus Chlorohelix allophototropha TaxID=3003348 RepID=A0A8T7M4N4_9CHLR|nr:ParA family protein [Chloroflexota bacterium]WJW70385.1 AAA family ATPase [Chloroflexota bacterium L227-S17]
MTAKIICLAQNKGGTAKTSSVLNLAACLVQFDLRVLTVDLDQQCNLTVSLGVDPVGLNPTTFQLITDSSVTAQDTIVHTAEGIDLLPASIKLGVLNFSIQETLGRERLLSKKIRAIIGNYDFVLIDTPPSFDIATLNGLTAADYLMVPVVPERLCVEGLGNMLRTYQEIRENSNPNLEMLGIFIARYDGRRTLHKELEGALREEWGNSAFATIIRERANMQEASMRGQSVIAYQRGSDLSADYLALTQEVLDNVRSV